MKNLIYQQSYDVVYVYITRGSYTISVNRELDKRYDRKLINATVEYDGYYINVHGYSQEVNFHNPDNMFQYDIEKNIDKYYTTESDFEDVKSLFGINLKKRLKHKYYVKKGFDEVLLTFTNLNIIRIT